jgi:antibiotic biosynthesis monooxygenase (ABM) superfamily enzyme
MWQKALCAMVVAVCLVAPLAVQAQQDYLDVYIAQVKPEKAADFDALAKKMAAANHKYNGDHWLAMETLYGENNIVAFISTRADYADIDKGADAFMGALSKAYGKEATEKMLHEWDNCLARSRSEFRRRRWDLTRKAPTDATSYAKLVGGSRVLRTATVHVRPGRTDDFEAFLKEAKAAGESNPNTQPVLVSQVVEGGKGSIFYITTLRSSLGGFDKNPTLKDILGEEAYKRWQQKAAEIIESTESMIFRFSPELSNPTEQVIAAAPDYWQPKPVVATTKPKAKGVEPAAERQKQQQ